MLQLYQDENGGTERERDTVRIENDALPLRFSSYMRLINAPSCKKTYELGHVVQGCTGRELVGIWEERGGDDVREGADGAARGNVAGR